MNQITKRNRLMAQMDAYAAFLPECPLKSRHKLASEIYRISREIEAIKQMTLSELMEQVDLHWHELPSKLNFT